MNRLTIVQKMEAEMQDKLYTVADLAGIFGVSRQTIHNWLGENYTKGRFPNAFDVGKGGGKLVLVPASDVEKVKQEEADKLIKELDRLGFQTVSA